MSLIYENDVKTHNLPLKIILKLLKILYKTSLPKIPPFHAIISLTLVLPVDIRLNI